MFVCVHVPDFPVEALVRLEPDLRSHAIAVVEGAPPVVNVVASNDRARAVGVGPGMTQLQAEERLRLTCNPKQWSVRQRSVDQEASAQAALLDCASAFSPRVEVTAPDTVIADIAGLEPLFGTPSKIACDLAGKCSETGLEVHVAVAANPDAALHAARGYSGVTLIPEGDEVERLGPLPLDVLVKPEYGTSKSAQAKIPVPHKTVAYKIKPQDPAEMLETLERWGVRTMRGLVALPEIAVVERLGQSGLQWQRYARGATKRELVLAEAPLEFEEVYELEYPVDLLDPLAFILSRMIEQLCARLQSRAMATHELRLRMKLDPEVAVDREGLPVEEKTSFDPDSSEEVSAFNISLLPKERRNGAPTAFSQSRAFLEHTIKLPVPMLDAKTFLKLLQLDLKANPPSAPVLKLWLRAEPVRPKFDQRGLFLPLTPEPQKLEITLARLSDIAGGTENVGSPELVDTHRPDSFRMTRFAPPQPNYKKKEETSAQRNTMSAIRRFRPPQPVSVHVLKDKPVAIGPPRALASAEEVTRVSYGDVVWCAGPWRTSGEWWNKEHWEREEWDLAVKKESGVRSRESVKIAELPLVHCSMLYRAYRDLRDGTWFVEGEYD